MMRTLIEELFFVSLLLACGSATSAQQTPNVVAPPPQHSEELSTETKGSPAKTPQARAELQSLLKALSGEWSLSVKWEPDASNPNGLVNAGEESWRAGPGGYTLLEEEHLSQPQQRDLFLLGIVWWNSTTKKLQGMECQNLLPYTCDVKGSQNDITMSWEGKQFVIDEVETSPSGKKSIWHEVWSDITPTSFVQTGEYGDPGGPRKRLFTIHATRITATQSKNEIHGDYPASSAAAPAPELQSLEKALKATGPQPMNLRPVASRRPEAPALVKRTGEQVQADTF